MKKTELEAAIQLRFDAAKASKHHEPSSLFLHLDNIWKLLLRKCNSVKNAKMKEERILSCVWLLLGLQWPENATYICCLSLANDVLTRISLNEVKCIIC